MIEVEVRLVKIINNSAVVVYTGDDGNQQACIIDSDRLIRKQGSLYIIDNTVLQEATPYGIDWSVVFESGLCINPMHFQDYMYDNNVISIDDLKKNPSMLGRALQASLNVASAELYKKTKIVMEDYNDSI